MSEVCIDVHHIYSIKWVENAPLHVWPATRWKHFLLSIKPKHLQDQQGTGEKINSLLRSWKWEWWPSRNMSCSHRCIIQQSVNILLVQRLEGCGREMKDFLTRHVMLFWRHYRHFFLHSTPNIGLVAGSCIHSVKLAILNSVCIESQATETIQQLIIRDWNPTWQLQQTQLPHWAILLFLRCFSVIH